jgi:hypothetical protein
LSGFVGIPVEVPARGKGECGVSGGAARFLKQLALWATGLILAIGGLAAVLLWRSWEPSGYANCVVVAKEADFVGERLKYSAAQLHATRPVQECVDEDVRLDGGDGPARGRVRWVECMKGPDCHEAAMF